MKVKDFLNQKFKINSKITILYKFKCELGEVHEKEVSFIKVETPPKGYTNEKFIDYQKALKKWGEYEIKKLWVIENRLILFVDKSQNEQEIETTDN